jgi:hypothetical protein
MEKSFEIAVLMIKSLPDAHEYDSVHSQLRQVYARSSMFSQMCFTSPLCRLTMCSRSFRHDTRSFSRLKFFFSVTTCHSLHWSIISQATIFLCKQLEYFKAYLRGQESQRNMLAVFVFRFLLCPWDTCE